MLGEKNEYELCYIKKNQTSAAISSHVFNVMVAFIKPNKVTVVLKDKYNHIIKKTSFIKGGIIEELISKPFIDKARKLIRDALREYKRQKKLSKNFSAVRITGEFIKLFKIPPSLLPPANFNRKSPTGRVTTYYCTEVDEINHKG